MNTFFLLIYFFVSINLAFSSTVQTQNDSPKIIVPFAVGKIYNLRASDCLREDGTIDTNFCVSKLIPCPIQSHNRPPKLIDVIITVNGFEKGLLGIEVQGSVRQNHAQVIKNKNNIWTIKAKLAPDELVRVAVWSNQELTVLDPVKVPNNGVININYTKKPLKKISLVGDKINPQQSVSVYLYGFYIGHLSNFSPIQLQISEGKHTVMLNGRDNIRSIPIDTNQASTSGELKYPIDIYPINDGYPYTIGRDEFKWDGKAQSFQFLDTDSQTKIIRIESVSTLFIRENSKVVKDFFKLNKGALSLVNQNAFLKSIAGLQGYTVVLDGTCSEIKPRLTIANDKVYDSKTMQKHIGTIDVSIFEEKVESQYIPVSGGSIPFVANLFSKNWDELNILQRGEEAIGDIVNLGNGPWGKEGWVKKIYVNFPPGFDLSQLHGAAETEEFKILKQFFDETRELQRQGRLSNPEKFIYATERDTKPKLQKVYNTQDSGYPMFVDLSNGVFSGEEKLKNSEVTLYDNLVNNKKIGSLVYELIDENLIGFFISVDGKKTPFVSNYFQGQCNRSSPFVALHRLNGTVNNFGLLGAGPWGSSAWVKASSYDLRSVPVNYTFMGDDVAEISLYEGVATLSLSRADIANILKVKIGVKDLQFEGGRNKMSLNCDKDMFGASRRFKPHFVKLFEESKSNRINLNSSIVKKCILTEQPQRGVISYTRLNLNTKVEKLIGLQKHSQVHHYPVYGEYRENEFIFHTIEDALYPFSLRQQDDGFEVSAFEKIPGQSAGASFSNLEHSVKFFEKHFKLNDKIQYSHANLRLGNEFLGKFSPSSNLILRLGPGFYPFKIQLIKGEGLSIEVNFPFTVTETDLARNVDIDENKLNSLFGYFELEPSTGQFKVSGTPIIQKISRFSHSTFRKNMAGKFIETDLKGYLAGHELMLIDPQKLLDFKVKLQSLGRGYMTIEGECVDKTNQIVNIKSYDIYSSPDPKKSHLGVLKIQTSNSSQSILNHSFISNSGQISSFTPNLKAGKCYPFQETVSLQQISGVKGSWSNLGPGPWGKSGWLNLEAIPILNSDIQFKLENHYYPGKLKSFGDKAKQVSLLTTQEEHRLELDKILRKDGLLIPEVSCENPEEI